MNINAITSQQGGPSMKKGYSEIPNVVAGQDDGAGDLSSSTLSSATASNSRMRNLAIPVIMAVAVAAAALLPIFVSIIPGQAKEFLSEISSEQIMGAQQLPLQQTKIAEALKAVEVGINEAAETAASRLERCKNIDWEQACDQISSAGARRRSLKVDTSNSTSTSSDGLEDFLLDSDDPSVTYDENCLRVYRLDLFGRTTFPYHANQLLRAGGNQTMTLFIQHGAMRNADNYFCSFRSLMKEQDYRPFEDILVIAPDFNYKNDDGVLPTDAFWNSTKPWGDWRVGAESDPECCANGFGTHGGKTISSFQVLDHMLGLLSDKRLYPHMNKISYTGHSAGGQMVQRYAIMSQLTANDNEDPSELEFIVANPSSYTYLDERRWKYACGECDCGPMNCTCDQDCSDQGKRNELGVPDLEGVGSDWVCHDEDYNHWPYGLGAFTDHRHQVPYAVRTGVDRAIQNYRERSVVYMVGQNDTCTDTVLPTCNADCWKRDDYLPDEWPCYRNHMDTRCPAMLEGPFRRNRGIQYMKYLEEVYGEKTHKLHVIPGVGHNATGMFGSPIGLEELFN
jgi:hypothetical protein